MWNVQPYQRISELQEEYTRGVFLATNKKAEEMAAQVTVWMKTTAPWTDRTEKARKGLTAFVDRTEKSTDISQEEEGMADAKAKDEVTLQNLNQGRRDLKDHYERLRLAWSNADAVQQLEEKVAAANKRTGSAPLMAGMDALERQYDEHAASDRRSHARARELERKLKTQKRFKRLSRVPKGQSAVTAFKKELAGMKVPLFTVRFQHNRDVTYAIWLEIAHEGRFNIIARTVDHWSSKFMAEVKRIANLKQYRDRIVLGAASTPEQRFADNAAAYEKDRGEPYRPWTRERQRARVVANRRYNPEEEKKRREDIKSRLDVRSKGVKRATRKFEEVVPQTMAIPNLNRRTK